MKEGPRDAVFVSRERRSVNKYRGRVWQSTLIDGVINHGATGLKVKRTGARHTPDRQSKGVFLDCDAFHRLLKNKRIIPTILLEISEIVQIVVELT